MAKKASARGRETPKPSRSVAQPAPAPARAAAPAAPAEPPAPTRRPSKIKVRAIKFGYYGDCRRRVGDVFWIQNEREFSHVWMERVDPRTPEKITTSNEVLRQHHDQVISERQSHRLLTDAENVHDAPTGAGNPLAVGDVEIAHGEED